MEKGKRMGQKHKGPEKHAGKKRKYSKTPNSNPSSQEEKNIEQQLQEQTVLVTIDWQL
jgi:hypothetical protein